MPAHLSPPLWMLRPTIRILRALPTRSVGASIGSSLDPLVYPGEVICAISAAESTGNLSSGLQRAVRYMENRDSLRKKMASALVYPLFVLALCASSVVMMMTVLMPAFSAMFDSMGVQLPLASRIVIGAGRWFPALLPLLILLAYCGIRLAVGDNGLKLPVIGKFRIAVLKQSFYQGMGEALTSGVGVYDSLKAASENSGCAWFNSKISAALEHVSGGSSVSEALKGTGIFDELIVSVISAGERSSSLDRVFCQLASVQNEEIQSGIKTFTSLLEPVSTLATGLVVGIIVLAMFLPLIRLVGALGG